MGEDLTKQSTSPLIDEVQRREEQETREKGGCHRARRKGRETLDLERSSISRLPLAFDLHSLGGAQLAGNSA